MLSMTAVATEGGNSAAAKIQEKVLAVLSNALHTVQMFYSFFSEMGIYILK